MIKARIEGSQTLALFDRVRALKAAGKDIVSFAAGEADFDTPKLIVEAAYSALKRGETRYVSPFGTPELREAVSNDYVNRLGAAWAQKENVLVTFGSKQAIYIALAGLLSPGDEVLIPKPYWVSYPGVVKAALGTPKVFETNQSNGFFPSIEELNSQFVTGKTKALIFSSPCNPTGCMISKELLSEILQWCLKNKVTLIYDEIYERLSLDGTKHISALSLITQDQSEYVICVNAASKTMAMTGWRIGYLISHRDNVVALEALQSQMATCAPHFIQSAVVEGLKNTDKFLDEFTETFRQRSQVMMSYFDQLKKIKYQKPSGAFYICADVSEIIREKKYKDDFEFCEKLLNSGVAVLPGSTMGMQNWVRFAFVGSEANLHEGLKRFSSFCR